MMADGGESGMTEDKKPNPKANRRQFLHGAAVATGGLAVAPAGALKAAAEKPPLKLNLKGYSIPLSPEGKASLVTPTPHHYGGQFIFVDYRADVKEVARFLPAPLEPEPTGRAFVIVNELFSIPEDNPDLIYTNPERTHYTEGVVAVRCSYRGTPGSYITAIWVSKDWSMAFGQFFGWPKKIADIHLTRVPPLHPTLKPLGVGSRVRGIVAREGYRLVDVSLNLRRQEEDSAAPSFGWLYSVRYFPEMGPTVPAVKQLIRNRVQNPRAINVFSGDAEFSFGESDNEELLPLNPVEIIKGYFYNPSWTTTHTAELLETYD
jgi:acetoacetate decarboxylase